MYILDKERQNSEKERDRNWFYSIIAGGIYRVEIIKGYQLALGIGVLAVYN